MKKRVISIIMSLCLFIGLMGLWVIPVGADTSGDYSYRSIAGGVEISGYNGTATEVVLPETIAGRTVVAFSPMVFSGDITVTSVTLSSGITEVPMTAFKGCTGLTTVIMPETVTKIGAEAFMNCTSLETVDLPNQLISLGSRAFVGSLWLSNQPDGIVYLENNVIQYNGAMPADTTLTLDENTRLIAESAFEARPEITSLELPEGLAYIGARAFFDCTSIQDVIIPGTVQNIGSEAFSSCDILETVTLNEGIKAMASLAFAYSPAITGMTIPSSMTAIGKEAFRGCVNLATMSIPTSVTAVGIDAFIDTLWWNNLPDGLVYISTIAYKYKGVMPAGTEMNILAGTTLINERAFYDCDGLQSVSMPDTVVTIGSYAFAECSNLISALIMEGTQTINSWAFHNTWKLADVQIPKSVTTFGSNCFDVTGTLKMIVYEQSAAHRYAKSRGIDVIFLVEIYFDSCGGSSVSTMTMRAGSLVPEPTAPTKTGYTFGGWHRDKIGIIRWNFGMDSPNDYMTLYAKWIPKSFPIAYQKNGGSGTMANQTAYFGGPTTLKTNTFTKTGYAFLGWAKTTTGSVVFKDKASAAITDCPNGETYWLYARWGAPILSAYSSGYSSVKVTWAGVSGGTAYQIYRATSSTGTYSLVYTASSTTRSWTDTGRITGKIYYYKIHPKAGDYYRFTTIKSAAPVPSAPKIYLNPAENNGVTINWTVVSGASGYSIYRATSPQGTYTYIHGAPSTEDVWTNTWLPQGGVYYYKIRAYHMEGTTKVYGAYSQEMYIIL